MNDRPATTGPGGRPTAARRPAAAGLLIDFDGVLRRFDAAHVDRVERRHGLAPGSLLGTAMQWSRLRPAISGETRHAAWMADVARDLGGAFAAVEEWQGDRGAIDAAVLRFVREVRAAGRPVGLATNATDLLDADLAALGLTGEFDAVVNSSVLGVCKPATEYFTVACEILGLPADQVLVVDDDVRCVQGARSAGLSALRWSGPDDLRYLHAALGVPQGGGVSPR
jgi:putative hydrolase of the HAD superfamily